MNKNRPYLIIVIYMQIVLAISTRMNSVELEQARAKQQEKLNWFHQPSSTFLIFTKKGCICLGFGLLECLLFFGCSLSLCWLEVIQCLYKIFCGSKFVNKRNSANKSKAIYLQLKDSFKYTTNVYHPLARHDTICLSDRQFHFLYALHHILDNIV